MVRTCVRPALAHTVAALLATAIVAVLAGCDDTRASADAVRAEPIVG